MYKLGIIGCGNMGEAILKGVLESGFLGPGEIIFSEASTQRKEYISRQYNIRAMKENTETVECSEYILMAVKPQNFREILNNIKDSFKAEGDKSLISIAAGIPTGYIENIIGKNIGVIRVMPNMPAVFKKGVSAISSGKYATCKSIDFIKKLMESVGEYVLIEEKFQNTATALNGSGPAYFFLFCKYLVKSGVGRGLDSETAEKLVADTMAGAAEAIKRSGKDVDQLIKMVSSPGGTTEQAVRVFENNNMEAIISGAVSAAICRAEELEDYLS